MAENDRVFVAEIAQEILDLPPEGQWMIELDGQPVQLLSFSSTVGEKDFFKIWIQGEAAIKVDDIGPTEPFNQLIFKGNFISDNKLVLIERYGYPNIKLGEEIEFLAYLITEGEWEPWSLRGNKEE